MDRMSRRSLIALGAALGIWAGRPALSDGPPSGSDGSLAGSQDYSTPQFRPFAPSAPTCPSAPGQPTAPGIGGGLTPPGAPAAPRVAPPSARPSPTPPPTPPAPEAPSPTPPAPAPEAASTFSPGEGGAPSGATGSFNMLGDQAPIFGRPTLPGTPHHPVSPVNIPAVERAKTTVPFIRAFKISDNQSPIPQDRVYFDFNYYYNVNHAIDQRFSAQGADLRHPGLSLSPGLREDLLQRHGLGRPP